MHRQQQNQLKANQKKTAGEFELTQGNQAYSKTGWGLYGMFATLDKAQSAVTGQTMTSEVAQIRKGERLMKEAEKIETAQNNTL